MARLHLRGSLGLVFDRLAPLIGDGFEDLSEIDGRVYSNKAPGLAVVGLPAALTTTSCMGEMATTGFSILVMIRRMGSMLTQGFDGQIITASADWIASRAGTSSINMSSSR